MDMQPHIDKANEALRHLDARIKDGHGRRGNARLRETRDAFLERFMPILRTYSYGTPRVFGEGIDRTPIESRAQLWRRQKAARSARWLANQAGQGFDEHGHWDGASGAYLSTVGLDFVAPAASREAPYFDLGARGLGLVEITRQRVYAKSSKWGPSVTTTRFLVGRNESGTFFSHAVPVTVGTVREAISWLWAGREGLIVARQGDVALVRGAGRSEALPHGHRLEGGQIIHATHPTIPAPGKGFRIIVARRAHVRASAETRD